MADNIAVTAGSGTTIATDEVGGAHYQYVKPAFGADGTATLVSTSNPLPSSLTNLEKAEDAAHTTADKGIMALAVCTTDFDGSSATDEDYVALRSNAVGSLLVQDRPNTGGGLSIYRSIDLDESEEEIKGSAGQLYSLTISNLHATNDRYVKLYNDTAANVIVGTTTPVATFYVKALTTVHLTWDKGLAFSAGICAAATTDLADAGVGAPGANEVFIVAGYK
jgi:hypothetical protein